MASILFIVPSPEKIYWYIEKNRFYDPNEKLFVNMSPVFIGTELIQNGHDFHLFDFIEYYAAGFRTIDEISEQIIHKAVQLQPDYIGITVWIQTAKDAEEITRTIKNKFPATPVIWGGNFVPLATSQELAQANADIYVKYAGEKPLLEILEGKPLNSINNLIYLDNDSIHRTPEVIPNERLMDTDLNWNTIKHSIYFNTIMDLESAQFCKTASVILNRGCPFNCNFCLAQKGTFPKPLWLSNQTVLAELSKLYDNYGAEHIHISDDLTFRDIDNLEQFYRLSTIQNQLPKGRLTISTRISLAKKQDYLRMLERIGCVSIRLGMETHSDSTLKEMNKKSSESDNLKVLENSYKYQIKFIFMLITGYWNETREDVEKNIRFIKQTLSRNSRFWVSKYQLYRGTPDYLRAAGIDRDNFTKMTAQQAGEYQYKLINIAMWHNKMFNIQSMIDIFPAQIPDRLKIFFIQINETKLYASSSKKNFIKKVEKLYEQAKGGSPEIEIPFIHDTLLVLFLTKQYDKLNSIIYQYYDTIKNVECLKILMVKMNFHLGWLSRCSSLIKLFNVQYPEELIKYIQVFERYFQSHRQYIKSEAIDFIDKTLYHRNTIFFKSPVVLSLEKRRSYQTEIKERLIPSLVGGDNQSVVLQGLTKLSMIVCEELEHLIPIDFVIDDDPALERDYHRGIPIYSQHLSEAYLKQGAVIINGTQVSSD